jgi:hypothetical protein
MAASLEANDPFIGGRADDPFGRDEEAVRRLGVLLFVTPQWLTEASVAAIGRNGQLSPLGFRVKNARSKHAKND